MHLLKKKKKKNIEKDKPGVFGLSFLIQICSFIFDDISIHRQTCSFIGGNFFSQNSYYLLV